MWKMAVNIGVCVYVCVIADGPSGRLRSFFAVTKSVNIAAGCSEDIEISFLPFSPGGYQCALILTDDSVGELLYLINGTAHLPLPEEIRLPDNSPGKIITCTFCHFH